MSKEKLSGICLLFAALLLAGCSNEDSPPDEPDEWTEGQNVYVAGYENIQKNPVARLWKNGAVQNLTGSGTTRSTGTLINSQARAVYVSGDDAYVAGWDIFLDEGEMTARARLWKNGEIQHLAAGTFSDQALSVFVSGDDVYVLGREALQPVTFPSRWAFKVWKNGEAEIFAEGNSEWQVNSIFVSDDDVYIAGRRITTSGTQAAIWKNGEAEDLAGKAFNSCAYSVFVSGDDVYVAGYDVDITRYVSVAKLWKNGNAEKLTDGTKDAQARSVCVSDNGDVYVAGCDGDKAVLWKNGIVQDIADDKDARLYLSVFVKDNDVYIAGYVQAVQEVEPGSGIIPVTYFKATLWKNGKILNLTVGKFEDSHAYSVFVK